MAQDGFVHVGRAARVEAAMLAQYWADPALVAPEGRQQRGRRKGSFFRSVAHGVRRLPGGVRKAITRRRNGSMTEQKHRI